MALQIKPKFRQITNPKFITFFSSSTETPTSSNLDSNLSSNKSSSSSSSSNNNTEPKSSSSSSLSSLASFFSPVKPSPTLKPAPSVINRKPRPSSSVFSFVSSSEQPTVKVDSLDEIRKKLFESRLRNAGHTVSPSSSSSTKDSTNDGYKEADFLSTLREGMKHMGSSGGENVNRVGSSPSPFLESLRFNKDDLNRGSGTRRFQFLEKEHPEAGKSRKPPFPYYDDEDGDVWEDAFNEYVKAEDTVGNDVLPGTVAPDGLITEDKMLVDTLREFHSKGLYDGDTDTGFKKGAWKKMKWRMRMSRCGGKRKQWIINRIRKLKTHWSAIHDLLTGQNCSGFAWDTEKKCVAAENDVWDAYVKAHPEAAELRNTSFPYYDDLCIIWAKDRATVEDAKTLTDDFEELDNDEAHPEAAKLRNPPFPLYNDNDGDAWDDSYNKDVTGENNALPDAIFDKEINQRKEEGSSIVPDGLKTEYRENRGPSEYRFWTITEDRMLVDTLLEFHSKGLYGTDYVFKKGALKEMQSRMKMTGCGLKGSLRIGTRLRKLRTEWFAIHDLLTGKNSSYFGWDTEKKCLTAANDVWDAYVQANPEAAKLRNMSFPYYDDFCVIWAKDRATGKDAKTPQTDDFEELDRDRLGDDIALSTCGSHSPNEEENSKENRKRTRSEPDDYFVEAMERALKSFSEQIEQSSNMLSQAIGLDITEKQMKINGELEKIDNLSTLARYKVGYMIASDVSKLNLFFSLPEEQKKDWVLALLDGEF